MNITGHHHISMYTKDVQKNKQFYTEILGLRLVEISVNQDNPTMYHFFYGDETGNAGTLLSFFEIKNAGPMQRGTHNIARLSLLLPSASAVQYFVERLKAHHITTSNIQYGNETGVLFKDPDDLEIVLINNHNRNIPQTWEQNPYTDIPKQYQILGMGPVMLHVRDTEKTIQFLTETLGFKQNQQQYTIDETGIYSDFIIEENTHSPVRPGRGYVHHIALTLPTDDDLAQLTQKLDKLPGKHTGIIDRYFFKSVYYRHNGIMFEFATDGPGFTRDTDKAHLGEQLHLPDFLEHRREAIEQHLTPLT